MKKQKKQTLLTGIIVILVIILLAMIASIVYEERINMSKQPIQNTIIPEVEEEENDIKEDEEIPAEEVEDTKVENEDNVSEEEIENKEEIETEEVEPTEKDTTQSKDEKAIQLAKKEWGNDNSVTFTVENKVGTKYYVAVKSAATVLQWYEVDTETWEISEY